MALRDPKAQRARAAKMLEMKILEGKTNKEIAKEFRLSEITVQKAMTLARKGDIVVSFEDKLMNELLPLAHNALIGALQDGNVKAALEIYKGAGVIRPHTQVTSAQASSDHDLSAYIVKKRQLALLEENTFDAQFTPSEPLALPEAPDSADAPDRESDGPPVAPGFAGSEQAEPTRAPENCAAGGSDAAPEAGN